MYRDLICLLAIAFFTGGSDRITPKTAAMARWFHNVLLSKIRFCSIPRSIAIMTALIAELRGVITRFFHSFIVIAFFEQFFRHSPHPRQMSSFILAFIPEVLDCLSCCNHNRNYTEFHEDNLAREARPLDTISSSDPHTAARSHIARLLRCISSLSVRMAGFFMSSCAEAQIGNVYGRSHFYCLRQ